MNCWQIITSFKCYATNSTKITVLQLFVFDVLVMQGDHSIACTLQHAAAESRYMSGIQTSR